ncbi:MAG: hypothetical protein Q4C41_02960 [Eggerthellaceae bacterium]|nr:hypothetical protein [Eggerthellaceae bacterium]
MEPLACKQTRPANILDFQAKEVPIEDVFEKRVNSVPCVIGITSHDERVLLEKRGESGNQVVAKHVRDELLVEALEGRKLRQEIKQVVRKGPKDLPQKVFTDDAIAAVKIDARPWCAALRHTFSKLDAFYPSLGFIG